MGYKNKSVGIRIDHPSLSIWLSANAGLPESAYYLTGVPMDKVTSEAALKLLCRFIAFFVVSYHVGFYLNLPVLIASTRTVGW